jgi:hypothetical protein
MFSLLDEKAGSRQLSEPEVTLAERFAYLWLFRYEVPLPLLHPPDKRFALASFRELGPNGNPTIDRLCEAFVTGEPFLDLSRPKSAALDAVV